jgi:hypothetical protein
MTYIQGIDYGPRKGTLGFQIHMSEGGDELPYYLGRKAGETIQQWHDRVRGVSTHVAILSTGERVQMLGWDRISGNLNPYDRSTDKEFYGRRFLLAVLGDKWYDPNSYTLAVEIAGKRANGPTRAQVESLIEWVGQMRDLFPSLRGAFGHADQTDTKGCPGTAPLMLEAWQRIGHGLFAPEEPMPGLAYRLFVTADTTPFDALGTARMGPNHSLIRGRDKALLPVPEGLNLGVVQRGVLTTPLDAQLGRSAFPGNRTDIVAFNYNDGKTNETYVALLSDVTFTPLSAPPSQAEVDLMRMAYEARLVEANRRIAASATALGVSPPSPI